MNDQSKICFFGGTFDPIHKAHLRIAREAKEAFGLTRVLFVPAGNPPHKEADGMTPFADRFEMVRLAVAGIEGFEASRLEDGEGHSYSIDTMERLGTTLPQNAEIYFLIGSDAFDEIETWKRWRDLAELVTFVVAARPGSQYKTPRETRVLRLDSVALETSSSDIRQRLSEGKLPDELPEQVRSYIRQHRLYGWSAERALR